MAGFKSIAKKILHPPGAQNCARLNAIGDEKSTTKLITDFALSIPPFNYLPAISQCKAHVQLGMDVETAVNAVLRTGAPAGRENNAGLVRAFFDYDQTRGYSNLRCVENFNGEYRLSRDVHVPTRPTFTVLENGNLVPVTVCGWKYLPLDNDQIRFWMTMLEYGLYSHADYRRSPAEVSLFIETPTNDGPLRIPQIIHRGDYRLLSQFEMQEQAELYVRAQAAALPIAEEKWNNRQRKRLELDEAKSVVPYRHIDPMQIGLFD